LPRKINYVPTIGLHVPPDLEFFPRQQHGNPVVAHRAADHDTVARLNFVHAKIDSGRAQANPRCRQVESAALASGQHLGIACHDLHPGCRRGGREALHDPFQRGYFEPFFDKGVERQVPWRGAADRKVIDGAVDCQRTNVATGKLQRLNDKAIGGHERLACAQFDRRCIERDVQ
jgi:hypothetical protein